MLLLEEMMDPEVENLLIYSYFYSQRVNLTKLIFKKRSRLKKLKRMKFGFFIFALKKKFSENSDQE